MKIASVTSPDRGATDRLLSDLADRLRAEGLRLAGIVKDHTHVAGYANGCDMKVRVLPDGPVIRITQDLGSGSDACRLDPGAIAQAVAQVEADAFDEADLFILNKFGPEEAAGRGFCAAIAAALERDIPVLVGVGRATKPAFDSFAGGLARDLAPQPEAILDWYRGDAP
ncbi:MAG: DUF2478 domain-containing protein [Rhodobacteraceae bacterium]|nr:MAG: DUF2478 domain-containing protein [Paracoccaceae bacterium]